MEDNLIGYLLNALDPETTSQVEEYLRDNPDGKKRLDLLRRSVEPLAADRNGRVAPPAGLADRTLAFVDKNAYGGLPKLPASRTTPALSFPVPIWRRIDMLVAACLLILVGGVGVTWVVHLQDLQQRLLCKKDLKEIHDGLYAYKEHKGSFPNADKITNTPNKNVAGLVIPFLVSRGYLPKKYKVHCPGGKPKMLPITFEQAIALPEDKFQRVAGLLSPGYGYSLGYRDQDGSIHGPPDKATATTVLMADCPPDDPTSGLNSPNHAGYGQNVLFHDGHVKFCPDRVNSFQGDDLYLNDLGEAKAGTKWSDNVIGHPRSRP